MDTVPRKPPIACSHKGCPILAEAGEGGLCRKHKRERHIAYQKTRSDGEHTKIYGTKAWKLARKAALQRDQGWGVICKERPADLVDHIKELKDGGQPYALDNLQSLCNKCHNRKTAEVAKER